MRWPTGFYFDVARERKGYWNRYSGNDIKRNFCHRKAMFNELPNTGLPTNVR